MKNLTDVQRGVEFPLPVPPVQFLLRTEHIPSDYNIGPAGPSVYDYFDWYPMWLFLDGFVQPHTTFEHLKGVHRDGSTYRHSLKRIHEITVAHLEDSTNIDISDALE